MTMAPELVEMLVHRVTFQHRVGDQVDDRGNKQRVWEDDPNLINVPAKVEWLGGSERRDGREVVSKSYRIMVNGDTAPITEGHRARWSDRTFEIDQVVLRYDEDETIHHKVVYCEEIR